MPYIKSQFGKKNGMIFPGATNRVCWKCSGPINIGDWNWTGSTSAQVHVSDPKKYSHADCTKGPDYKQWQKWATPTTPTTPETPTTPTETQETTTQETQETPITPTPSDTSEESSQINKISAVRNATNCGLATAHNALKDNGWDIKNAIEFILKSQLKTPAVIHNEHFQLSILERIYAMRLNPDVKRKHVNIYLGGSPGAGKSYNIKLAAERAELEYAFIALSDATMPSAIFGYQTADGDYVPTVFYHFYLNGGVLDIAELDNCNANVFTLLNNALDNGSYFFPGRSKDEAFHKVTRHKDCIVVGNGNTFLRGPSDMFPARQQQDAAAIERFRFINWQYDEALELHLTNNSPLTVWAHQLRALCAPGKAGKANGEQLVVSMRGILDSVDLLNSGFSKLEAVNMAIFKEYEDREKLLKLCPINF